MIRYLDKSIVSAIETKRRKHMKKMLVLVLALCLLFCTAAAYADGKVMLYSSMQEDQLMAIEKAFEAAEESIVCGCSRWR